MKHPTSCIKIFKNLFENTYKGAFTVFLPDRPGALYELSKIFGDLELNITYFYYNRSVHPNKVLVEATSKDISLFYDASEHLRIKGFFEEKFEENISILYPENILKLNVALENRPGALAEFSYILKNFQANVVFMEYNENLSENLVVISFYVANNKVLNEILNVLKKQKYYYTVSFTGNFKEGAQKKPRDIIGLNLIERFYFELSELLGTKEAEGLKNLIESSKSLSEHLLKFSQIKDKLFEKGRVFSAILNFAATSRLKKGKNFFYTPLPPVQFKDLTFYFFRMPTGGNLCIVKKQNKAVMIDGTYGLYYEEVKKLLQKEGIPPEEIREIYLTHADADHAGLSGYFEKEFGTKVFLHPDAFNVIKYENRAWGVNTPIAELNKHFTALVNSFTEFLPPQKPEFLNTEVRGKFGDFNVIDKREILGEEFFVIESLGGHVPGQVFYFSPELGIIFTADYLLNIPSLREEEKEFLSLPRYLMTSTNTRSEVFREEMEKLKKLIMDFEKKLNKTILIVPGHGDYYYL